MIGAAGGTLEVDVGWPMSADYLHAASSVSALELEQEFCRMSLRSAM